MSLPHLCRGPTCHILGDGAGGFCAGVGGEEGGVGEDRGAGYGDPWTLWGHRGGGAVHADARPGLGINDMYRRFCAVGLLPCGK